MTNKIKLAIIGFGRMGLTHYSIINSRPDVEIESIVDTSPIISTMMKKYLPIKTYKDYSELFEKSKPDAILVCTPPNLHYDIIKRAANKGIHVFAEKPFTTKFEDAKKLNNLYDNLGLVNQVGYVNRFNDVFVKTKELLDMSVIGKVIRFKSEMFSCTVTKFDDSSGWRASKDSGGGAIFEMASHAIDLVNFLIGKPDKIIGSSLNKIYSKAVEDAMSTTLLYKNATSGTIYINWSDPSYRKPTNKIEIFGDRGRILADQHSIKIFLNKADLTHNLREGWNTLYITDIFKPVPFYVRGNEFTRQLYHFIDCIQDDTIENKCNFEDGTNVHEVIDKISSDFELNGRF